MYTTGDFLIQVKNAYGARKKAISYPYSNVVLAISKILEKEGYIKSCKIETKKSKKGSDVRKVEIELKYEDRTPAIIGIKLVSKPSVHHYFDKNHLTKSISKYGIGIISTSHGIMTTREAKKKGVGGEMICQIT